MTEMHAGNHDYGHDHEFERQTRRAGVIISAALIAGLAWWGGTLVLRDVTEVPVIAAQTPEFRTEPADPGGQIAPHQGLAVTQVASEGTDSEELGEVFMAPFEEEVALPDPGEAAQLEAADLRGDDAINAAVTLALGDVIEAEAIDAAAGTEQAASTGAMLRPRLRPAGLQLASATTAAPAVAERDVRVPPRATPLTGPMVQLGAYDSAAIAEDVRERLYSRFGASFSGRPYFVMEAVVSGTTYHRLRVGGFDSRAEANRFCQVMAAEGVDCLPVSG